MDETVFVIGHKNPDTDSVCSAIAYAELKKMLGIPAVPARAGELNRETAFVLRNFGAKPPVLLDSVRTQVADLDIDVIDPVPEDISIRSAWGVMQKNNRRVLPVADESGRFLGIVTLSDIAGSYMNALETNSLSASGTPLKNIMETIGARLAAGKEEDFHFPGKVAIAASAGKTENSFCRGDIVLTGGGGTVQRKAIGAGACCVVLTCGGKASPLTAALAGEKGCLVLETGYDTFTAARLINQSIPVSRIMTRRGIISFSPDDYIGSIRDRMLSTRYRSYPVLGRNGSILGFLSRYHLISRRRKKVILVDHNERAQAVDGTEEAEILEIIDHHRIGGMETGYPVRVRNEIVGSTATIVAGMYAENGLEPAPRTAGLLCAAILSDTLRLRSPTAVPADAEAVRTLARIAGIGADAFASAMFRAGSSLDGMSPEDILRSDFKEYSLGGRRIGIGQIHSCDPENIGALKDALLSCMKQVCRADGFDLLLMMLTDIAAGDSSVLFAGDCCELARSALHPAAGAESVFLKGVVSRKKQIVPLLARAAESL